MPLNLPNVLTLARIVLILPFALCFAIGTDDARWVAFGIYVVAALTDWLDGFLARRLKQFSAFGRMLDPIADKLLVAAALLLLIAADDITGGAVVPALAILLREIFVSGLREHLGPMGVVVPVTPLAKWKTTAQLIALGILIAPVAGLIYWFALILLWVAAALTLVTGWHYWKAAESAIGEAEKTSLSPNPPSSADL